MSTRDMIRYNRRNSCLVQYPIWDNQLPTMTMDQARV